jgi:stage III sporulation protein AG
MTNFTKNIKSIINGEDSNSEHNLKKPQIKTLSKILGVAALGMFVIYLSTVFTKPATIDLGPTPNVPTLGQGIIEKKEDTSPKESQINQDENTLEKKLEATLGQIEGVGEIAVTITLSSTPELKYALNKTTAKKLTQEKDQGGGSRTVSELNDNGQLVLRRGPSSENEVPVVVKEIKPDVKGILVVATGARNPQVRRELTRAVQTLLGISSNKVTVMPKGGR